MSGDEELEELRRAVDKADKALLAVLEARLAATTKIVRHKRDQGVSFGYNPAREARLLRNLRREMHDEHQPLLDQVVRSVIAYGLPNQGLTKVYVHSTDILTAWDMARSHFGFRVDLRMIGSARETLNLLRTEPNALAVLPWPGPDGAGQWWPVIAETYFDGIHILGAWPVTSKTAASPVIAILGRLPLESSDDDDTLLLAYDDRHLLRRALNLAKLEGFEVARARSLTLIRLKGMIAADDDRLGALETNGLTSLKIVGAIPNYDES